MGIRKNQKWTSTAILIAGAMAFSHAESGADLEDSEKKAEKRTEVIEKIMENPSKYYGKKVEAIGKVDELLGKTAFILESDDLFFDDEILVLTRSDISLGQQGFKDDQRVQVSGTVRSLVISDIERDLGWDLSSELEVEYESKPVIIAQSIVSTENPEWAWNESSPQSEQTAAQLDQDIRDAQSEILRGEIFGDGSPERQDSDTASEAFGDGTQERKKDHAMKGEKYGDGKEHRGQDEAIEGEQFGQGSGPITDISEINGLQDAEQASDFVGREVDLDSLIVQAVDADEAFWVGKDGQNHMLVVMGDVVVDPGTDESSVHIQEGQLISLQAEIMAMPDAQEARQKFKLSADQQKVSKSPIYLQADQVSIQRQADEGRQKQ